MDKSRHRRMSLPPLGLRAGTCTCYCRSAWAFFVRFLWGALVSTMISRVINFNHLLSVRYDIDGSLFDWVFVSRLSRCVEGLLLISLCLTIRFLLGAVAATLIGRSLVLTRVLSFLLWLQRMSICSYNHAFFGVVFVSFSEKLPWCASCGNRVFRL